MNAVNTGFCIRKNRIMNTGTREIRTLHIPLPCILHAYLLRQIIHVDIHIRRQIDTALDDIFQLADIAGPEIPRQQLHSLGSHALHIFA